MSDNTPENRTDDLDALVKTFRLIKPFFSLKIGAMFGILIVFWYCFFNIQHLPAGLDLSANILFAFIALAMGFIYLVAIVFPVFMMGSCGFLFIESWRIENKSALDKALIGICCITIIATVIFLFCSGIYTWGMGIAIIISAVLFGFAFFLIVNTNNPNTNNNPKAIPLVSSFLIILAMFLNIPFLFYRENIEEIFEKMGIRQENVAINLTDMDYKKISQIIQKEKISMLFDCSNQNTIYGVNVLWHGIGTHTLIGLPKDNNIKLPIKKDDAYPIKGLSSGGCVTLSFPSVFEKNKYNINEKDKGDMKEKIEEISKIYKTSYKITRVEIKTFADKTEFYSQSGSNVQLSKNRANAVKEIVEKKLPENKDDITSSPMGFKYAAEKCDGIKNQEDLAHCQAPDRKVEIKFYFEKKPEEQSASAASAS